MFIFSKIELPQACMNINLFYFIRVKFNSVPLDWLVIWYVFLSHELPASFHIWGIHITNSTGSLITALATSAFTK